MYRGSDVTPVMDTSHLAGPHIQTTPETAPETAPEKTLERTLAWTLMRKLEKTLREHFENYIYFLELFEYSKY